MKILFVNRQKNHTLVLTEPKVAIIQRILVCPLWVTKHKCASWVISLVCKPGLNLGMTWLTTGVLTRPEEQILFNKIYYI